jgi:hypothetical protein
MAAAWVSRRHSVWMTGTRALAGHADRVDTAGDLFAHEGRRVAAGLHDDAANASSLRLLAQPRGAPRCHLSTPD